VVRLTGDCPLTDPDIVAAALDTHRLHAADHTSNVLIRTYPDGLDVEVVGRTALLVAARRATDAGEREHVTPFVYRRPNQFQLAAFRSGERLGGERWTVDTMDDLIRVRDIVSRVGDPLASWRDMLRVAPPAAPHGWQVRIADEAEPIVPGKIDTDDPGARVWVVTFDGMPRGWVRAAVQDGRARIDGRIDHLPRRARRLVDDLITRDPQIVAVEVAAT
jgi:hypothetical protein